MRVLALRRDPSAPPVVIAPEDRESVAEAMILSPGFVPGYVETLAFLPFEIREPVVYRRSWVADRGLGSFTESVSERCLRLWLITRSPWSSDPPGIPPPRQVPIYIEERQVTRELVPYIDTHTINQRPRFRSTGDTFPVAVEGDALPPSDVGIDGAIPLEPVEERNLTLLAQEGVMDEAWAALNKRVNDVLYRGEE